jgi:ubiquinone/menaquinone biosynthesis C-methylase UbiE
MSGSSEGARRDAWSSYWSSGRLHSCAEGVADNYGGAIGHFWRGVAERLRPEGRMLDLATGNGPLPWLFWQQKAGGVRIDAVDMATLSPSWHQPGLHDQIHFHPGVALESLPFEDGAFDLVVSQYGIEYADRNRALAECARVAAAEAVVALVMHHAGSVLVAVGKEELAHQERLLAPDGLLASARAAMPWIARARDGQPVAGEAANQVKARYNQVMQDIGEAIAASPAPDLLVEARANVHALLGSVRTSSLATAYRTLDAYVAQLEAARLRTAELVACALDRPGFDAMADALRAALPRHRIECGELAQAEGVLGWSLVAAPEEG